MSQAELIPRDVRAPAAIIQEALDRYGPVRASFCLFSGGGDSSVLAHVTRGHYDALFHIDTGTSVPGVQDHVRKMAAWLEVPVLIYESGDAYRNTVLGSDEWWERYRARGPGERDLSPEAWGAWDSEVQKAQGVRVHGRPLGFPSPLDHSLVYSRIKERQVEALVRDHKEERSDRILLLTGVRAQESERRMITVREKFGQRIKAQVYANPIAEWSAQQMALYRREYGIPVSDVAALLHKSGECNCGSFSDPSTRDMLRGLWPSWWAGMEALEREAEARGLRWCRWGGYDARGRRRNDPRIMRGDREAKERMRGGILCQDCQLDLFS